jgi:hypothetical protein
VLRIRSGRRPTRDSVAAGDALRAFRAVAEDKQGDTERWRFFLHSAGIAQYEVAGLHAPKHLDMPAGIAKRGVGLAIQ